MSPGLRKFLITTAVVAAALMIVGIAVRAQRPTTTTPQTAGATDATATPKPAPPETAGAPVAPVAPPQPPSVGPSIGAAVKLTARPQVSERAVGPNNLPTHLGSLDPKEAPYRIDFAPNGAGIAKITFSDYWKNATARLQAKRSQTDPAATPPSDDERYVLASTITTFEGATRRFDIPVFAAHSVEINGVPVVIFGAVWSEEGPGRFATELVDESGAVRYRIVREYHLGANFDFSLRQMVTNLTDAPASVRWVQYGPCDLVSEPIAYVDARRLQFGYLLSPERDPAQDNVLSNGQLLERAALTKQIDVAAADKTTTGDRKHLYEIWPNAEAKAGKFTPSWLGSKNRYFTLCVHAPWTPEAPTRSLAPVIDTVRVVGNGAPADTREILTELHSPAQTIAPAASAAFDLGVYAGPLNPHVLGPDEPYASLSMSELIVYMLSAGCCASCTFAWLAHGMASFLSFLHDWVVFDWGLAIIALVIVVRLLLHPVMKRSQVQMQRFSRGMAALKPELDALKSRYPNEPQKVQQEQMRLYREKGVNPVGCLGGILPSLLQMPIWIALYAVLFFSWDLRQSPAFFGIFQLFGGWSFLGDLSRPDNFVAFPTAFDLKLFKLAGINLLPLLMGVVFYIQQKYMTPPQANLTPEQESQQKMMKWMMILMFPLMLYPAPSGLTLYILTSTCIGIWESKMVKKHIDKYGFEAPKKGVGPDGKKKQDRLGKMYEQMLDRARQKQSDKGKKTYKERE